MSTETKRIRTFKERITFERLLLKMIRDIWKTFNNWDSSYYNNPDGSKVPNWIEQENKVRIQLKVLKRILEGIPELRADIKRINQICKKEIDRLNDLHQSYSEKKITYLEYWDKEHDLAIDMYSCVLKAIIEILDKHGLLLREKELYHGEA